MRVNDEGQHSHKRGNTIRIMRSNKGKKFFQVVLRGLLLLLCVLGFFLSCTSQGRAITRSTMILPALINADEPAPLVVGGDAITHKQMTLNAPNGIVYLDVYEPVAATPLVGTARSGVLIIPGVGDNRQVPQLVNLSEALAHAGIVVMDMLTSALTNYTITAQDSEATVLAYQKLSSLPGMQSSHSGIIAFSGGVPLACFAAADPRIRTQVAYLALFGGYFNTTNVLRAFGKRAITIDGKQEAWTPTIVPLQTIANIITQDFDGNDQYLITNAIEMATPLTSAQYQTLSPSAQAAYHLLEGDDPAHVEQNIAALPASIQTELTTLSPGRVVSSIHAPIYLLHDRHDTSIPVTESRDFAAALARLHHPYNYVEFSIFDHVEIRSGLPLGQIIGDGTQLLNILRQILTASS